MIPLFLALAAQPSGLDWAEFSRAGALNRVRETIEVKTARSKAPNRLEYEMIYTRDNMQGKETFSTTSIKCPAVRSVIISMRGLTMPRPAPYGVEGDSREIVVDGSTYTLSAPTDFTGQDDDQLQRGVAARRLGQQCVQDIGTLLGEGRMNGTPTGQFISPPYNATQQICSTASF